MRKITDLSLEKYKEYLYEEEKSVATVNKYINDLNNTTLQLLKQKMPYKALSMYNKFVTINKQRSDLIR